MELKWKIKVIKDERKINEQKKTTCFAKIDPILNFHIENTTGWKKILLHFWDLATTNLIELNKINTLYMYWTNANTK